jgi:hypothetical protein
MKKLFGLVLILSITGCAVCKSSDTPEQCRTKQRDHSQKSSLLGSAALDKVSAGAAATTG